MKSYNISQLHTANESNALSCNIILATRQESLAEGARIEWRIESYSNSWFLKSKPGEQMFFRSDSCSVQSKRRLSSCWLRNDPSMFRVSLPFPEDRRTFAREQSQIRKHRRVICMLAVRPARLTNYRWARAWASLGGRESGSRMVFTLTRIPWERNGHWRSYAARNFVHNVTMGLSLSCN